ncbi:MAG: ribosome silencing factor, partial [Nitrospinota bacterium]
MTDPLRDKVKVLTAAALSKKAEGVVALDLRGRSSVTDGFLICHGHSGRQVRAIADAITQERGVRPLGVEGYHEGRWVLMDCNDVVVHIFVEEARRFYDLERLWAGAPEMELDQEEL